MRLRGVLVAWAIGAIVAASCGRLDFSSTPRDAAIGDGARDAAIDAPALCNTLPTETIAQCQAALANPAAASDQVIFDCAYACAFGKCEVHGTCSGCACLDYVYSHTICPPPGMTGSCAAPLSGTGCVGGGFYSGPPLNCTSANGIPFEAACILRKLVAMGDC